MKGHKILSGIVNLTIILSAGFSLVVLLPLPSAGVPAVGPSGCVDAPGMPCGGGGGSTGYGGGGGLALGETIANALEWLAKIPQRMQNARDERKLNRFFRIIDEGVALEEQGKYAEAIAQFEKAAKQKPYYYERALRGLAHAQLMWAQELYKAGRIEAAYALFVQARDSVQELIDYSGLPYENFDWVSEALAWPDFVGKQVEKLRIARKESAAGRAMLEKALKNYAKVREKERQSVVEARGGLMARMKFGDEGDGGKTPPKKGTDRFGTGGTPEDPEAVDRPAADSDLLETALQKGESAKMHGELAVDKPIKEDASEEARKAFDTAGKEGPKKVDSKLFGKIKGTRKGVVGDAPRLPKELLENPGWKILENAERELTIEIEEKRLEINSFKKRTAVARQTGDNRESGRLRLRIDILKQARGELKEEVGEVRKEKKKMMARFHIDLKKKKAKGSPSKRPSRKSK